MTVRVLLLGRMPFDEEATAEAITAADVALLTGTRMEDVTDAFDAGQIDVVIMGAGIPLRDRLAIVEHIFTASTATSVHMKDRDSGREGMMPFVNAVLRGSHGRSSSP